MEEGYNLKDFYNKALIQRIASSLKQSWTPFDDEGFVKAIMPQLEPLALLDRAKLITDQMYEHLPQEYPEALNIIQNSFGPELDGNDMTGMDTFFYLPHAGYVGKYGLDHFELSMQALYEITKRFTSEWPIRPFLERYEEQTLAQLNEWIKDENVHVRRLVSEGSRPRLPWAGRLKAFQKDPSPVLALLEQLKEDPELYVRRSVANNLNDIAKDHPEVVIQTLKRWNKVKNKDTQWIIGHASRTLVKQGHKAALELLGFPSDPKIEVKGFKVQDKKVVLGGQLVFAFDIRSTAKQKQPLMVDYIIHFMKANGQTAPKVFKLSKKALVGGDSLPIEKRHAIRPISTRKYYPGKHFVELQINGKSFGKLDFELRLES